MDCVDSTLELYIQPATCLSLQLCILCAYPPAVQAYQRAGGGGLVNMVRISWGATVGRECWSGVDELLVREDHCVNWWFYIGCKYP